MFIRVIPAIFFVISMANGKETKNYVRLYEGFEYGRYFSKTFSVGLQILPDFREFDDSQTYSNSVTSSTFTLRKSGYNDSYDFELPVSNKFFETRWFRLIGTLSPLVGFTISTIFQSTTEYDSTGQITTSQRNDDETTRWHFAILAKLEPSFSPHPQVDIFWPITTGLVYEDGHRQYSSNYRPDIVEFSEKLVHLSPSRIDLLKNIGVRIHF